MTPRRTSAVLVLVALSAVARTEEPRVRFEVTSDFGSESAWVEPYLEKSAEVLIRLLDNPEVTPPARITVKLTKDAKARGIRGGATPISLEFTSSRWPKEHLREWIVAHELGNLFAAHYAGSGGFPSDWWSNGRSPFPEYVSCLVMEQTGHDAAAKARRDGMQKKPDHVLYWKLHERHGFAMFANFFKLLRKDGVNVGAIGAPWPSPDRRRSAYTMAYLSLAAGTNVADLCREHGVGRKPIDWDRIHPEIPFPPYEVSATDVERILAAREWLFGEDADPAYFGGLRDAYRRGDALDPSAGATGTSGIAFEVASEFGEESDWVAAYLERLAVEMVGALGGPDRAPPKTVKVTLRKDEKLGAIGGGESRGALTYVSNVWPAEQFRFWALARGLAKLLVEHYGGTGLPTDWWVADVSAFSDAFQERILTQIGEESVARFVRSMRGDKRTHALFAELLDDHGTKLFGRFLGLLRSDGVDLAKVGRDGTLDPRRTEYAAAYLSIAAGTNLAPLLRKYGVGKSPPHWNANSGKFPEYELTDKAVERVMKQREKLFTKPASEKTRDKFRRGK